MSPLSLGQKAKTQLIERFLHRKPDTAGNAHIRLHEHAPVSSQVSEEFTRFDRHPEYEKILVSKAAADRLDLRNPFFISHEAVAGATTRIAGREYLNFSSYNYLGLAGHPVVNDAAKKAIDHYGTSASASRLVAGERPVQRALELALASHYEVEDCVVFVSGHATNVSTIATLFGTKDLVVHDSLIHNSVIEGIKLSGASRRSFPHNNLASLDSILAEIRAQFERVLIVVEGHYSMDGDLPDLPALIKIKRRHKCFLMVDEAHALGVVGPTGKGLREHYGSAGTDVDIWMGTLSKTLAGCGGYIAGERALIETLKYKAAGFVYSVGLAPPLAAASLAALEMLGKEPDRVTRLQARGQLFLRLAREAALNTGTSLGIAIIPIITGSSLKAISLSSALFDRGVNVQPVIYPAVEERSARLRFFLSEMHNEDDIRQTCKILKQLY